MKVIDLEEKFYYEDEKKSFKPKKMIVEMIKLINDDRQKPIYQTTSFNDIINSLNRVLGIRVSYIPSNKTFIYADINQWVHPMMLIQALNQGLFPNIENFNQLINSNMVYNFGITNKEDGVKAFENDSYNTRRDYKNFIIMTRPDQDIFEKTDLQDIISKVTNNLNENYNYKNEELVGYKGIGKKINEERFPSWFSVRPDIARSFGRYVYKATVRFNKVLDLTDDSSSNFLKPFLNEEIKTYTGILSNCLNKAKDKWNKTFKKDKVDNISPRELLKKYNLNKDKINGYWFEAIEKHLITLRNLKSGKISKLFQEVVYPNWNKIIEIAEKSGYDGIISKEESYNKSKTDYGFVVINPKSIINIERYKDI